MTKVKICGISNYKDALNAVKLGADYIGLNFYKHSPRYVEKSKAKKIIEKLKGQKFHFEIVGVFVNEKIGEIKKITDFCNIDLIQLSGDENLDFLRNFKKVSNKRIIKSFRIRKKNFLEKFFFPIADYILLDSYKKGFYGGTGTKFDWSIANEANKGRLFLSGGLNVDNVDDAIKRINPYAVDVCSGVEIRPGKKDFEKIKKFIKTVNLVL